MRAGGRFFAGLSASSRMITLWRPAGSVTFFCANILIFSRTTCGGGRGVDSLASARQSTAARCCAAAWASGPLSHRDAAVVGGVQLEHAVFVARSQQLAREAQDTRGLAGARGPLRRGRGKYVRDTPAAISRARTSATRERAADKGVLAVMMRFGMLPSLPMMPSRLTVASLPTMSHRRCGRYFSTLCANRSSARRASRRDCAEAV